MQTKKTEDNSILPTRRYRSLWPYAGIFIFILLSVLIWGVILNGSLAENKVLFDKYFSHDINFIEFISENPDYSEKLDQGLKLFAKEDYRAAIDIFDEFPDNHTAMLYRSISFMKLNQHGLAALDLDRILNDSSKIYYDQAKWYRALLYLKLNQSTEATQMLDEIAADHGVYKTKALMLRNEINPKR
ncbi:MAG: hypothetical protein H3C41_03765 [Bacteroidales bacterium]|nr:hypothetical protein [Bacteroidales bacterium]